MILGMTPFTFFHVLLSLIGIGAGFVVVAGMLQSKPLNRWTAVFLSTTVATTITGFMFPFVVFLPSHGTGIVSSVVLGFALYGRYARRLAGPWLRIYVINALVALYLNVFVLVVQLFLKIPPLRALAPTQTEPIFAGTQAAVFVLFVGLTVFAAKRYRQPALHSA